MSANERQGPVPGGLHIDALFPTFVFGREHPAPQGLNETLLAFSYAVRASDEEGGIVSARGGWQSKHDMQKYPEFQPLVRFIDTTMIEVRSFLSIRESVRFYVCDMWININGRGGYNVPHIHGNSYFSGVYYVKTHEGCGEIAFHEPMKLREYFNVPYAEVTPRNCFQTRYRAVPGRMYVFPSYLPHEVTANEADEDRVSVSFNILAEFGAA
ncbi:MAG: TIGR02466 family protein [Gammaproteobacteria bacterium]|nr:TIGR02466 family protein [Gammaproteobacteria bacterium]